MQGILARMLCVCLASEAVEPECSCDLKTNNCDCCCDLDCTTHEKFLLDCVTGRSAKDSGYNLAVNRSNYLGIFQTSRTWSSSEISQTIDDLGLIDHTQAACGETYCAGQKIFMKNATNTYPLVLKSSSFGECAEKVVHVFEKSSVNCPKSVFSGCLTFSNLALDGSCVDPTCVTEINPLIYRNYKTNAELVNLNDPALEDFCIESIWYSIEPKAQEAGYTINNFTIWTDFGETPSLATRDVHITLDYISPFDRSLVDRRGYFPNEDLMMDGTTDFSNCFGHDYTPRMGEDVFFSCFSSLLYDNVDDCSARFDKILARIEESLMSNLTFYTSGAHDRKLTIVKPSLVSPIQPATEYCQLPNIINHQFIYKEQQGVYLLDGLHVSIGTGLFGKEEEYSLKFSVNFMHEVFNLGKRLIPKWCGEIEPCFYIPQNEQDFAFLLIINIFTMYICFTYIFVVRDPVSYFKYKSA